MAALSGCSGQALRAEDGGSAGNGELGNPAGSAQGDASSDLATEIDQSAARDAGSPSPVTWALRWWGLDAGTTPFARLAAAYDAAREITVVGTGNGVLIEGNAWWTSLPGRPPEFMAWNGNAWLPLPGGPATPFPVSQMIYDSARQRIVTYWGCDDGDKERGCGVVGSAEVMMAWDGTGWSEIHHATPPAEPRGMMVYDRKRDRIVLSGWRTWEFDGNDWSEKQPYASTPQLYGATAIYDEARGRVFLVGGNKWNAGIQDPSTDVWEWDGNAWTRRPTSVNPPLRSWQGCGAYDSARQVAVLFGGADAVNFSFTTPPWLVDETWEWDGTTWLQQQPTTSPSTRPTCSLAFDTRRSKIVMPAAAELIAPGGSGVVSDRQIQETWEYP